MSKKEYIQAVQYGRLIGLKQALRMIDVQKERKTVSSSDDRKTVRSVRFRLQS